MSEPEENRDVAVRTPPMMLQPRSFTEAVELSKYLATSDIVPKDLHGKPANILAIMLYGAELGIPVITAMQVLTVINGRPSMMAVAWGAKVRERGHRFGVVCGVDVGVDRRCGEWAEHPIHGVPTDQDPVRHPYVADHTGQRCTIKAQRRDTGETAVVTWTIEDAIQAGLLKRAESGALRARSKNDEVLPWEAYPADQLYARTLARVCRRIAPETALGLYTYEEMQDMAVGEPTRVEATVGEPVDDGPPPDPDEARRAAQAAQDGYTGGQS